MPKGNAALGPEEENILEALRQRFNQPNWTGDPCDSSWITCSNDSQVAHVEAIDLVGRNLAGTIPDDVANLRHIKRLDLKENMLEGPIPDLSNMTNLTHLDLSWNKLSGRILDTSAFTNISSILLSNNNLSGGIPASLFQHPSATTIDLRGNRLGGPIPDMSDLINLRILDLSYADINGSIPESINKLAQATKIYLLSNMLEGPIPDLSNMTKLTHLDLRWNKLSGRILNTSALTSILSIRLRDNNLSGGIPASLFQDPSMIVIDLGNNPLGGPIPDMSDLIKLRFLYLSNNPNLKGTIPNLSEMVALRYLDLRNNMFQGTVPEALAGLPNLTYLRLESNSFTAIPEALIKISKERQIYLTYDNNTNIIRANSTATSDLSTGAIVGIVIAIGVLVSIIGLVLYLISRRNNKHADQLSTEDMLKSSRAFTLKQIKAMTANNKTLIGKGGFGQVYHGKLPDGEEVAVKIRAADSKQGTDEFSNEVCLLSRLHHRNLVPLVGYCLEAKQQILVYQYMAQGTLHKHLYHTGSNGSVTHSARPTSYQPLLDWKTRLEIAVNAARGLEYLHKDCNPPVIHRDVKTSNILLTEKLQAKVADFGISKETPELDSAHNLSGVTTVIKGTFGYLDPESDML